MFVAISPIRTSNSMIIFNFCNKWWNTERSISLLKVLLIPFLFYVFSSSFFEKIFWKGKAKFHRGRIVYLMQRINSGSLFCPSCIKYYLNKRNETLQTKKEKREGHETLINHDKEEWGILKQYHLKEANSSNSWEYRL